MSRKRETIVAILVALVAIPRQLWAPFPTGYAYGNAKSETTTHVLGWPRQYFSYSVTEGFFVGPEFQLEKFSSPPRWEKRTDIDLSNIQFGNLAIVITWWSAVAGCLIATLPLLRLRWNIKSLLLLQASIAVLVLLR